MIITRKQKQQLCALAAATIEQHEQRFKPTWVPSGTGARVTWQVWRGMVGDLTMCTVTLRWSYATPSGFNAAEQDVHVCQRLYQDECGRWRVHLVGWHLPVWRDWSGCVACGEGFSEQDIMVKEVRA